MRHESPFPSEAEQNSVVVEYLLNQKGYTSQFHIVDKNLLFRDLRAGVLKENYHLLSLINRGFSLISLQELHDIEKRWIPDPDLRYFYKAKRKLHLSEEERQWITQNPVIKLGALDTYPPYSFLDAEGNFLGISREYISIIEKATGLRFEIIIKDTVQELIDIILSGEAKVVPFAIKLPEREKYVEFTKPYKKIKWHIITRKDHPPIHSPQKDLKGLRIGILKGFALWEIFSKDKTLTVIPYMTPKELWHALSEGKIDAVIDTDTSPYFISKFGLTNLRKNFTSAEELDVCFGVIKDTEHLKNIIDKVLDTISSQEHQEITNKWTMTHSYYGLTVDFENIKRWAIYFGLLFIVIIVVSILWNLRLKREIKNRKLLQDALEKERQNLMALIEGAPVGILIIDRDYKIVRHNNNAKRYLRKDDKDYSLSLDCIKTIKDSQLEENHDCLQINILKRAINDVFEKGENTEGLEFKVLTSDEPSNESWIKVNVSKIFLVEDTYAILSIDDITIQKNAEKVLIEARYTAERATQAKSDFLASMSHEIRTPLNSLVNMNLLLLETELNAMQREFVNTAVKSSEILLSLVNDILDISKIEAGKIELEHKPFSISEVVMSVIMVFKVKADEKGISLTYEIDESANIVVFGDSFRVQQILLNLISNAIKFTHSGGVHVKVSCTKKYDDKVTVSFSVIDTGIGIKEDIVEKIFEPFLQADSSTTRRYGGTGLGLSISKKLTEMMCGQIIVKSKLGQGSTFTCSIPFEVLKQPITKYDIIDEIKPIPKGLRILLAEDNILNQAVIKGMLRDSEVVIDIALNGKEALSLAQKSLYDVILMDIEMPEMDGIEATRLIRNTPKPYCDVPIIAVTAHTEKEKVEYYLKEGMDDFLPKPISKRDLFRVINTMTQHKQKV